jgi:multiple sugar transport system ATP-binding protein
VSNLTFKGLGKVYTGGVRAVSDFYLEIEHGEFVIFVGPSGCGKSTVLRMIAGLEEITEGTLYIDDKIVNNIEPKDRDIAMVFQNYALYPHMTVYENMAFGLKMRKVNKEEIDKRVKGAADILDIEELLDRKPKALSGGQRQRVALGRAIVRSPKVFLMDEPLSNLDAKLRVQTRAEIVKLHKRLGTTFIYVTHDQIEAMTMGDKIVVMKDGMIQQFASPQELYNNPANLFVAGFIGSPQMNFIDVTVIEKDNGLCLKKNRLEIETETAAENILRKKGYIGKTIVIGIRPEDVYLESPNEGEKSNKAYLNATVDHVENMGSEKHMFLKADKDNLIARAGQDCAAKLGDEIKICFNISKIHYFDKDNEQRIIN